jgi:translation initiation factor 2B subunit (eIF-2B alpha/beta/delta family)
MDETEVVTCFLRNDAAVLLCRRSEAVDTYPGTWGAVAGHAEGDPDAAARAEIREETGLDGAVTLVRRGDPFEVVDRRLDRRWVVHPYLFDCATRAVETNWEAAEWEWVAPTAILTRETVPDLWRSYDRVRPSVETVAGDREHGSASLSVRALEVLRDEAAVRAHGTDDRSRPPDAGRSWAELADVGVSLCGARPSMPVVRNRVDRAMAAASESRTASAVEHAATAGIAAALDADRRAAAHAAERVAGVRVVTLSRSGTVAEALSQADPEAVLVAESRPGGEGRAVAEALAAATEVTLTTDAALAGAVAEWDADAVLVGADAVRADGTVHNKAGTRAAALAGTYEGVEVLVAAASDKITHAGSLDPEPRPARELYDGPADLTVYSPTFDATPADCVDAVVTETGALGRREVADVADAHRRRARWRA